MIPIPARFRKAVLFLPLLAMIATLRGQEVRPLEWRIEQQPTTSPCGPDDLAFANAPEQMALERSYSFDSFDEPADRKCELIKAAAFNGARVLIIFRPSVLDDGWAYTLIQPRGASSARLIPFSGGGRLFWGNEDDWHNRAAMNAMLQMSGTQRLEDADWLAISLAYLTILGEAPTLQERHYAPGPTEHFQSYSVPGLLAEVPALEAKHLLPTAKCNSLLCEVRFYYRTEPVEPLKTATFRYLLQDGRIWLASAEVVDYAIRGRKKQDNRR